MSEQTKVCTKCGKEKSLDLFCRQKNVKIGVTSACKECRNLRQKELRSANPERTKEYKKKYYWANPSMHRQKAKEYAKKFPERIEQRRLSRREQDREYRRMYYQQHKDQVRDRQLRWRLQNPDKYKSMGARSTKRITESGVRRTDEWRKSRREWARNNKDKTRRYAKKQVDELSNAYVARCLVQKSSLKAGDIRNLIELKRAQLQIYRFSKQLKKEIKNV